MNQIKSNLIIIFLLINITAIHAATIKGKVTDISGKEIFISATIYVPELQRGTTSGLDGTYRLNGISVGTYKMECYYIGYKTETKNITIKIETEILVIDFKLEPTILEIEEISITAQKDQSSENSARNTEKLSLAVVNVVSSNYIQLSPDLNVANAIQRVSGITLEKGTTGSGQYALLRGMDKRYNSSLVNGIRIPGTHNKYRFVALELFPSELLERLEIFKSLTADMEADAIAGTVNMMMKNAPDSFVFQFNCAAGYSMFFNKNGFLTFNTKEIDHRSPYEINGNKYNATVADFPVSLYQLDTIALPLSNSFGVNLGNRFLNKKLGVILAGNFSKNLHGTQSAMFDVETSRDGKNLPLIKELDERIYTENQQQYGIHTMIDFRFNRKNKLQLYTVFLNTIRKQIRNTNSTELEYGYDPDSNTAVLYYNTRFRLNSQMLFNTTLQGEHILNDKLLINWSSVFSAANNASPDNAIIDLVSGIKNGMPLPTYVSEKSNTRRWEHNSDRDFSQYLKLKYSITSGPGIIDLSCGIMYRNKYRTSFYNQYILQPYEPDKPAAFRYFSEKGIDWNTYDEINWHVYNPRGSVATALNFDATENIGAAFLMAKLINDNWQIAAGLRSEYTNQGYLLHFPIGELKPEGKQIYTDILPSFNIKYVYKNTTNYRFSYYKAINRPGFLEIVPYITVYEEYTERGNPDLRHTVANNVDLRVEYFPNPSDQILAGIFYKQLVDPIEYALIPLDKHMNLYYMPQNFGTANNYGLELDFIKYVRQFGVKTNYTWTNSSITTDKLFRTLDSNGNAKSIIVSQVRPLYGQAEHVANLSLLFKSLSKGFDAQLSLSYTGERIYMVSAFLDNDLWQKPNIRLDASLEKTIMPGLSAFVKLQNVLNTHTKVFIKKTNPTNYDVPYQDINSSETLIRNDFSGRFVLAGIRYTKLNL